MANISPPLQSLPQWRRYITLTLGVLFSVGVALALRSPRLDERPMHNDEAVNAIKFSRLLEKAGYQYDPNEHHGPTLYYASLWLAKLTRAPDFAHFTETRLRALTVLFGVGLILLLPLTVDGLGRRGTIWAAIFTAISPAFVFYSRYYIHEMLLVFFAFLSLAAGWRYWRSRRIGWALLAGAGLGLMYATKETFVITVAAAGVALAMNQVWNRLVDASGLPVRAARLNLWHMAAALGVCLFVALALFTSFFTNASGPIDSIRTYGPWLNRAGGASEHIHKWNFYFHRLLWFHAGKGPVWTESLILALAVIGGITGFLRKNLGCANASFVRFLSLFSILLAAVYAVIGYKTPWCLLNFWHPMILLAGVGAAVIVRGAKHIEGKIALATVLMAGGGHLFWQAAQAAIPYAADQRNPYAYAQTSPDVVNLSNQLREIAAAHPDGLAMVVKVISSGGDYWPLPWYLRQFKNVGWWDEIPADPFAPVMIVSAKWNAALDEQKTHLMVRYFALRPQVFLEMYVQLDLWRAYLTTKPPEIGK